MSGWVRELDRDEEDRKTRFTDLCAQAKLIEDRSCWCPHCGTRLTLWEPLTYDEKYAQTDHKWCSGCCCVLFNRLIAYMNVPDEYQARV